MSNIKETRVLSHMLYALADEIKINVLQQQRDELLAALEACVDALDRIKAKHGIETSAEIAGRAAIVSTKGQSHAA